MADVDAEQQGLQLIEYGHVLCVKTHTEGFNAALNIARQKLADSPDQKAILAFIGTNKAPEDVADIERVQLQFKSKAQAEHVHQLINDKLDDESEFWQLTALKEKQFSLSRKISNNQQAIKQINTVLHAVFCQLLDAQRPLRFYECTFFLPLFLNQSFTTALNQRASDPNSGVKRKRYQRNGAEGKPFTEADQDAAQAYLWFSPNLRDQLYDIDDGKKVVRTVSGEQPVLREWHVPAISDSEKPWKLHMGSTEEKQASNPLRSIIGSFTDCRLFHYGRDLTQGKTKHTSESDHIYILAFRLQADALKTLDRNSPLHSEDSHWWHALIFGDPEQIQAARQLQAQAWLRFTALTRLLYPSFTQQEDEGKISALALLDAAGQEIEHFKVENKAAVTEIPQYPTNHLSDIVLRLVQAFFGTQIANKEEGGFFSSYSRLYDNRMYVNAAYAFAGPGAENKNEQLWHRDFIGKAVYVDELPGFSYKVSELSESFISTQFEQWLYPRWEGNSTLMAFSGIAAVYSGMGWYFSNIIASKHTNNEYQRLVILNLFYQAMLRQFDHCIETETAAIRQERPKYLKLNEVFRKLHLRFIKFSNQQWFRDVNQQMQGREIYRQLQSVLEHQKNYEVVKDKLARTDDYLQAERGKFFKSLARRIAILGTFAGLVGTAFSVLSHYGHL